MDTRAGGQAWAVTVGEQLSTRLGDEVVILGLREGVYYGLTNVGARVWELLQTPRTLDELVNRLVAEYDVPMDTAAADVHQLLIELEARGLVVSTASHRT